MTGDRDDLDELGKALKAAVPPPDPARKQAALQAALRAHDDFFARAAKKTAGTGRPTGQSRRWGGLSEGAQAMWKKLTSKQILAGTTALAALALVVVVVPEALDRGTGDAEPERGLEPVVSSTEAQSASGNETERATREGAVAPAPGIIGAPGQETGQLGASGDVVAAGDADMPIDFSGRENAPPELTFGAEIDDTEISRRLDGRAAAPEGERSNLTGGASTNESDVDLLADVAEGLDDGGLAHREIEEAARRGSQDEPLVLSRDPSVVVPPEMHEPAMTLYEPAANETYPDSAPAGIMRVADAPVSTFSADVDTASYSLARSSLMAGFLPDPQSVRPEEFVNYFTYAYPAPEADGPPFRATVTVDATPWNADTRLVQIGIQGRMVDLAERPPFNAVFLIDTSGSMQDANKLPLVKQALTLLANSLREGDEIAIVTYAGNAGVALEPTGIDNLPAIRAAIARLGAGGSTAGAAGIDAAYAMAERMAAEGETTRVYLATDGDFNVGASGTDALQALIEKRRETGAYLSVLSFGRGNIRDDVAQTLAQAGNGQAAYIDTVFEAQRVLIDQQGAALVPIAGDLKLQVEWNPAAVSEYRLIGYETRALAREDFNNDAVDAGDIGAGHQVTAMYEVALTGQPGFTDPLRYASDTVPEGGIEGELGWLKMRWKEPGEDSSQLVEQPILSDLTEAIDGPSDRDFAAAIAGFAELLHGSKLIRNWDYQDAADLARANRGDDPTGARAEAIRLIELAGALDN
jgi:Ca-activated chloride channel family protein